MWAISRVLLGLKFSIKFLCFLHPLWMDENNMRTHVNFLTQAHFSCVQSSVELSKWEEGAFDTPLYHESVGVFVGVNAWCLLWQKDRHRNCFLKLFIYFLLRYSWFIMLCSFQVYSKVIYLYTLFFKLFFHVRCYKILPIGTLGLYDLLKIKCFCSMWRTLTL